jgi:hypothetical protein
MPRPTRSTSRPSRSPRGGTGTIPIESLAVRVARLEALIDTLEKQVSHQLRRTGELQAQLDRALKNRALKPE